MELEDVKQLNIPKNPGCYLYLDQGGKIIYVGKAANLASRVLSYWSRHNAIGRDGQTSTGLTPAKELMLTKIKKIEWRETDSEIEALLLEANLIKKYQPDFNIIQRDDKRYAYIKVSTEEEWPRIFFARKLDRAGRYFGPFVSSEAVRETLRVIRKIWPFRSCTILPKKVCLYYRIGKCPGMCENLVDKKEYNKTVKQITLFLEGKKKMIVKDVEQEIKELEKTGGNEEKINFLQFRLLNMKRVLEHSNILSLIDKYSADVIELAKVLGLPKVPTRIEGYDISNIFGQEAVGSMVVFGQGEADKNEYRKFKIKIGQGEANDVGMLSEVMERRLNNDWPLPDLIIIDGGKAQLNVILSVLKKRKLDIPVLAISKGEGLRSAIAPDKIFFPGEKESLVLPLASPALHIIKRVRDEAHRFAIKYHRELRAKRMKVR
ncbi:MAG: excinuclease ABC subunit UvrC [Candidatus Falkowbacteria bacterium]|nr:excinuclease ABC subunit UvrC [Candidatus Falkowbacteria bacterium]